jgi:hypothetical protein
MTHNFANMEPVLTVIISRESVEGTVASAEQKSWRPQIYRLSRSGKSPDKFSDDTGKTSTLMLVTLKVSHSELLDFECQIRGNLADGRKLMEPLCAKR